MNIRYEMIFCQQLQAFHASYQPRIETYAIQKVIDHSVTYHTCVTDGRYRTECLLARRSIISYIWQFDEETSRNFVNSLGMGGSWVLRLSVPSAFHVRRTPN